MDRYSNLGTLVAVVGIILAILLMVGVLPLNALVVGALFAFAFATRFLP